MFIKSARLYQVIDALIYVYQRTVWMRVDNTQTTVVKHCFGLNLLYKSQHRHQAAVTLTYD